MSRVFSWTGLAFFAIAWLAIPAVTLADDCSDWSPAEVASCPSYAMLKVLGFIAGAILAAGAWIFNRFRDNLEETARFFRTMRQDPQNFKEIPRVYRRTGNYPEDDPPPGVTRRDYDG